MERLLTLKLDALDCEVEALLNGVPLARASTDRPCVVVPVHEYIVAGVNRLELVIWPRPAAAPADAALAEQPALALVATGKQAASLRILLPRVGSTVDEASARSLAQLDWAPAAGHAYQAPCVLTQDVELPVSFPRWRWLEAPVVEHPVALQPLAHAFILQLSQSLGAGELDGFISATRWRTEELAVAYQRNVQEDMARQRAFLERVFAKPPEWMPMEADNLVLRPVAQGRLLECLDISGLPMLRTAPDDQGRSLALPLRLAAVDNRLFVLR